MTEHQWLVLLYLVPIAFLVTWIVCVALGMKVKEATAFGLIMAGMVGAIFVGKALA